MMNENDIYNSNNYNSGLVDVTTGLSRGNMFVSLYKPYMQTMPLSTGYASERENLMQRVQEFDFASRDIGLYLDVHPNDQGMIDTYNFCNDELKKATEIYEKSYEPITLQSETLKKYPWAWIQGPWPWEKQKN